MEMAESWWSRVYNSYQSAGRHYHTLNHIHSMLGYLKKYADKILNYYEVFLAIFFHELVLLLAPLRFNRQVCHSIVYEPKAHDNEESSAGVFLEFARECLRPVNVLNVVNIVAFYIVVPTHSGSR